MISIAKETILREIKKYTENSINIYCYHCNNVNKRAIEIYIRWRTFTIFTEKGIDKLYSFLSIYECNLCHRGFTNYPPFLSKYQRFISHHMLELCLGYLENPTISYRKACRDANNRLYYHLSDKSGTASLSHTAIYRWVCYFARFVKKVSAIREQYIATGGTFVKRLLSISVCKYKSDRKRCDLLLSLENIYVIRDYLEQLYIFT